jgi:DNA-binding IclR family transcriptional regulator
VSDNRAGDIVEIAQTADHALRILLSLAENGGESVAQISRRLGLSRTVAQRLVATLQQRGFVAVIDGRVEIGSAVMTLADRALPAFYRAAQPALDELARTAGETVVLSVLEGVDSAVVAVAGSDRHPLRVEYPRGFRHHVSVGAAGRAILMGLGDEEARALLAAPEAPAGAQEGFVADTARGYVITQDELRMGANGIAVPVRIAGRAGSVSIVAPAARAGALPEQLAPLRDAARRIGELEDAPSAAS